MSFVKSLKKTIVSNERTKPYSVKPRNISAKCEVELIILLVINDYFKFIYITK